MSLLNFLFPKKAPSSSSVAKERLQIIIARQSAGDAASFLPQMEKELLEVIRKYVKVSDDAIKVSLDRRGDIEVLDVNVVMPDAAVGEVAPATATS